MNTTMKRKILIAQSSHSGPDRLRSVFQDEYEIIEAVNGEQVYELLKNDYKSFSLLLLDLRIRDCDGLDLLERISSSQLLSSVPVIVLTDSNENEEEDKCLRLGAVDFLTEPYRPAILYRRVQNIIRMRELSASIDAIEIDELTGLYTKQAFFHYARLLIDANPDQAFSLVISDIQNFKLINSAYGEAMGDEILRYNARALRNSTTNGICARYGGDQFVLLARSLTEDERAAQIGKQIEYEENAPVPSFVLKYGMYENVDHSISVSRMCDRALLALKSIKNLYNVNYAAYDGEVSQQQLRAQSYEAAFNDAMEKKEFIIMLQSKISPYSGKIIGAEALVRWKHGEGLIDPPTEFLDVFEKDGLIAELDEYVFRTVCGYQRKRAEEGRAMIPVSVNLSRISMHKSDIVERYSWISREYGVDPSLLPIEITESAAVGSVEIKPLADSFFEAGFPLHMDDFGSGHSSLNGLNILHFDVIKLDKSLIDYIGDKRGDTLLMYTMALAKELGLNLVAEGVENREQLDFLMENGCDAVQGYYYSKPVTCDEFDMIEDDRFETDYRGYEGEGKYALYPAGRFVKVAVSRILQRLPGGFLVYEADHADEKILASNPYLWHLFGYDSEQGFMEHVGGTISGLVCEDDYDRVNSMFIDQMQNNEDDMLVLEHSIVRKNGEKVPVVCYGHIEHLDEGDVCYVFIRRSGEIDVLQHELTKKLLEETRKQREQLKEALDNYKQADYDRRTDFLTGLRNRQDMFEFLQDALSGKRNTIRSMYMLDIDDFKKLNDRYGHSYGDECLKRIGRLLKTYGEENDISFYRYGGEEILGIGYGMKKTPAQVAEELVSLVRKERILRDDAPNGVVTVSLGYTSNNRRFEKMIDIADAAMYRAKARGKDRAVCMDDEVR